MEGLFKFFFEEYGTFFEGKIALGVEDMGLDFLIVSIDEVKDESIDEGIIGGSIDFVLYFSILVLYFFLIGADNIIGRLLICCICHYIRLCVILILSHFKKQTQIPELREGKNGQIEVL